MVRFRFVHAADLHLDSPFKGMKATAPENVRNALHVATFKAFENIVELCISERVDALLVAGDVYDSADRSLRAQRKFVEGLERLHTAGIRSFVCHGNHDPLDGWEARLKYPPSCTRFGATFEPVPVFEKNPERAIVVGISYPKRDVTQNLVQLLGRVDPGPVLVGLLHANVGNNLEHGPYAPCSLDDLLQSGMDYWALGHVHTRQVLHEKSPTVVYPGNSQGRHPNETGPRGVYVAEVDDRRNICLNFRPVDIIRWERLNFDISNYETDQHLIDGLHQQVEDTLEGADGRPVVLRITLAGRGGLYVSLRQPNFIDDLREELNDAWARRLPFAWCERIENETSSPLNRQERLRGSDFLAEVLKTADQVKDHPELLARFRDGLSELYQHHRYRRHLSDYAPVEDDLTVLISEAETIAADLLAGEDDA